MRGVAIAARTELAIQTARDLFELGLVDGIVPEPLGGAHNDTAAMAQTLKTHLIENLKQVQALSPAERLRTRYEKFRHFGAVSEREEAAA